MTATASYTGMVTPKVCFNFNCKVLLDRPCKGWRRRTGEFAELCDRCESAYKGGNFCETFHLNSSGWRCCESCGKQIHCGCIVSFHMFVLLDAGGIECITCARKSFIMTPNPAWPPPSLLVPVQPERIKDISARNWTPIVGSGPVPWRQAPSVFNGTSVQHQLQPRMPTDADRHRFNERLSSFSVEKRKMEDSFDKLMNGSLKISCSSVLGGGSPVGKSVEQPCSSLNHFQQTANSTTSGLSLAVDSTSKTEADDQPMVAGTTAHLPTLSPQAEKQSYSQNQVDVSEGQPCNGKAKGDILGREQLLPRYRPQISEEELQKISEVSNSVITPLFEKMLSASDAGRIGRLVLPKKCAEAYFPPISQPEGVPLKVQDLKGQEWIFQFRFWPNNNSRMYVLEGIMPCIQSMQLQAGDIVTFSRIEPEGNLVMGCRKTSAASSDKGNSTCNLKYSLNGEAVHKGIKCGASANHGGLALPNFPMQGNAASPSLQPPKQQTAQSASTSFEEADKLGVVGQADSSARGKRKNSTVGLKRKRLRIDSEDVLELKVSWEQVQGLFRRPTNKIPTVFVIEGCEFEEFEQAAPVIGRPTIPESDGHGKKVQWVQCEKCFKWRKIPADALLKSKWTCSENLWDPARSVCSANEELTAEKLDTLLTTTSNAASEKMKDPMLDPESLEALEGLDALADLAIQEKATSSQPTSRHPRHKPGCSCIVCLQPPSGKGPKHKQPCDCVVCKSVKRRFETLMLKREQKQLEKEPESRSDKLHPEQSHEGSCKISSRSKTSKEEGSSDECPDNADKQCPASPLNDEIDLNIQPDRPELQRSACFHSVINTTKEWHLKQHIVSENIESSRSSEPLLVDSKETHQRQQGPSEYVKVTPVTQTQEDGTGNIDISTYTSLDNNHESIAPAPKGIIISSTIPGS